MGGSGNSALWGGGGSDNFVGNPGISAVAIANFKAGTEHIALQGYGTDPYQAQSSGGNMLLSLSDHSTVTLLGVTQLDASSVVT
jgi:hypothetical protein